LPEDGLRPGTEEGTKKKRTGKKDPKKPLGWVNGGPPDCSGGKNGLLTKAKQERKTDEKAHKSKKKKKRLCCRWEKVAQLKKKGEKEPITDEGGGGHGIQERKFKNRREKKGDTPGEKRTKKVPEDEIMKKKG